MRSKLLVITTVWLALAATVSAQEWGHLTGRFLLDGERAEPARLTITKDVEVCGPHNLVGESLTVNPENNGVQNVVLFLYLSRGATAPDPHPSYADMPEQVRIDNENCRFAPHIVMLTPQQTLVIGNPDPVAHNSKLDVLSPENTPINPIIPPGQTVEHRFRAEERLPSPLSCSIHPWMKGWVVVKDSPYMAITDENGEFTIENLPAGNWNFRVWQENCGYVQNVTVNGARATWRRGEVEVEIKGGETTDLGEVRSQFQPAR